MVDYEDVRLLFVDQLLVMRFEKNEAGNPKKQGPKPNENKAEFAPFFIEQNRDDYKGHTQKHDGDKEYRHPAGIEYLYEFFQACFFLKELAKIIFLCKTRV